jgi:PAS domain S-box-containing protein
MKTLPWLDPEGKEGRTWSDLVAAIGPARGLLDLAGVAFVALHRSRCVMLVNRKACEMLGRREDELVGVDWFESVVPTGDRERVGVAFDKLMTGQLDPFGHFENDVVTREGKVLRLAWTNDLLRAWDGEILGSISLGRDLGDDERPAAPKEILQDAGLRVQERLATLRHANEVLRAEMERNRRVDEEREIYERVFQNIAVGLFVYRLTQPGNPKSFVLEAVNATGAAMAGMTREAMVGRPVIGLESGFENEKRLRSYLDVLRTQRPSHDTEFRNPAAAGASGRALWLSGHAFPIGPDRLGLCFQDVTERRAHADEKRARAEELARRSAELARSNEDLDQFASLLSHDLHTLVAVIQGNLELFTSKHPDEFGPDDLRLLDRATDAVSRIVALVDDGLAYARIDATASAPELFDCDLLVDTTLGDLAPMIRAAGAIVTRDDLPVVEGNRVQLGRVFQNLLSNALKFHGPEPLRIHVGCDDTPEEWRFFVRDNGLGIDPRHAEDVFEMFRRLHGRTDISGSGIGLTICRKILQHHSGRIWVESTPGQGATFFFTLPKPGDETEPMLRRQPRSVAAAPTAPAAAPRTRRR